jgi:hypothetical protein
VAEAIGDERSSAVALGRVARAGETGDVEGALAVAEAIGMRVQRSAERGWPRHWPRPGMWRQRFRAARRALAAAQAIGDERSKAAALSRDNPKRSRAGDVGQRFG